MKKTKLFLLLPFFICSINIVAAQNVVIIDDTSTQHEFTVFQNAEKSIVQKDIQTGDVIIKVDQQYGIAKVVQILPGDKKSAGLKKATKKETGLDVFILPKKEDYADSAIFLSMISTNKKEFRFKIITNDAVEIDTKETAALDPCKAEELLKIGFTFINPAQMNFFFNDPCGGEICKDCEPKENIIEYDFLTNTTTKKFPEKSRNLKVGDPVEFILRHVNPFLYDVTISDTGMNYNTNTEGSYLYLLASGSSDAAEVQYGGEKSNEKCELSASDSLRKAVVDLYTQLLKFGQQLKSASAYTDASCFRQKFLEIRNSIDAVLSGNFGTSLAIYGYTDLIQFMSGNKDVFKDTEKMEEAYKILLSPADVYAYKIPQVANVDEVQFRFNILPKNKEVAMPIVNKGIISTYTKGGFKVDVSSGLYYSWLNDKKAGVRLDSTETSPGTFEKRNRIYEEDLGKGEFGFASFIHFYPRTGGFINISGSIGAGLSFLDKPKPRYFGGISILAGRGESRVALNLGSVAGNTTRISDQYPKDASGNYLLLTEAEKKVVTKQKFTSSFFVSISYNLPFALKGGKKPQTVSAPAVVENKSVEASMDSSAKEKVAQVQSGYTPALPASQSVSAPIIINSGKMRKEKVKKKFQ